MNKKIKETNKTVKENDKSNKEIDNKLIRKWKEYANEGSY